ncbi:5-methyltetrahydropteroyltriglutamate--homocysteine S-methyltransferase [Zymobacter palmae]|uniref:5-methyltetrahydropteroyltriglutamate--homocysteine methyltransferase n=1 Tax=Zymobacter palmae TaxID=33074 RepID=A0A348HD32_9GAMM|nr:5-methyltetrahydropteroyltriglutamate--homocysteine S-methyltransferase [Zymobacter palmae]BBG29534.1 methionine synthase II [Zymobacter palmae]
MTVTAHTLGYPRIGAQRELKKAQEGYWQGEVSADALEATARELRARHWNDQKQAGLEFVTVGDFAFYDHVLNITALIGAVPARFEHKAGTAVDLDTYFRMARGRAPSGKPAAACGMTKFFGTNYHYMVPELEDGQTFSLSSTRLFDEVQEALDLGHNVKVSLIGPVTYLWLARATGKASRLDYLDQLVALYGEVLAKLKAQGVEWVQLDEPLLVQEVPAEWAQAVQKAYTALKGKGPRILLATYFGAVQQSAKWVSELPVDGVHLDLVFGKGQDADYLNAWPQDKVLSLGVIDGRNIWRKDTKAAAAALEKAHKALGDRLWVAGSSSLLHTPVDLSFETDLPDYLAPWLAFARQKLDEIALVSRLVDGSASDADKAAAEDAAKAVADRAASTIVHRTHVADRLKAVKDSDYDRQHPYAERAKAQRARFNLPLLPTTTIGSFPQTQEIRAARRQFKRGELDQAGYEEQMKAQIADAVKRQEEYGIDVLVHGEAERNDMVEYFGEQLDGFAFTRNGWVQSYGSRCVKPPIIFGDVERPQPMTVRWSQYAQSLTDKPMKGMLTGPVTVLQWSFVRDDQPREVTCRQIALALRDEVVDLEKAGIGIIQIDEPAVREGLPLQRSAWDAYLEWAVGCFRLSAAGVQDETQIHTHMCYSEFNDIIESIAALDADVITIETSRSHMVLLEAFRSFEYPNEIGPGVYDIHSPNIPSVEAIVDLLDKAAQYIPVERLWVNPDCGLKTRRWEEVDPALHNMVAAARQLRARYQK